ncbi:MAG: hypothetical protein HY906_10830 [Deltaproteobacteria bacterium]|nr:hypothetical protein [Deltaproteobacteria bacterium]
MWGRRRGLAVVAAAILAAACGGEPAPRPDPLPRWDARPVRAAHPEGRILVEFPGFLEPQAANDRTWLHVAYKAKDAWLSIVFLRDCLEPGPGTTPCPEVNGCAVLPGTTTLLPLGRERGRLLEVVRTTYFWNTQPRVCARVNLRVATRRPEYDQLTALLRDFPTRVRILHSRGRGDRASRPTTGGEP